MTGATRAHMKAAVLGSPIAHSLSPVLHRAAYASLGLDWSYDAVDVDEKSLPAFVDSCGEEWAGLSLTMPLKQSVLPLVTPGDDLVELVGAANTVVFEGVRRVGYNTDVYGIRRALGLTDPIDRAVVIGAGSTARSALVALAQAGCSSAVVILRSPAKIIELQPTADRVGVVLEIAQWSAAQEVFPMGDCTISTTPGDSASVFASAKGIGAGALLDVTYVPWPTTLAGAWQSAGGVVASGLSMLLWQAVEQVRLMTGGTPDVEAMRAALARAAGVVVP